MAVAKTVKSSKELEKNKLKKLLTNSFECVKLKKLRVRNEQQRTLTIEQ